MMFQFRPKSWVTLLLVFFLSCSSSDSAGSRGGSTSYDTPKTFFSTMNQLTVEIAYEPDAEPYVGNGPGGRPLWNFVKNNLAALFEGRETSVTVTVPTTLAEMQAIPDRNSETFSIDAILEIAELYRRGRSTATEGNFFLVFLNGYYEQDGQKQESVIGVNISGTTILAMFKPVIASTSTGFGAFVPKFVELTTAVHEMGHALGLVNNGVSMHAAHQDEEHGKHCDEDECVMYYLNEGASDMQAFVVQLLTSGSDIFFDEKCLNDARNYHP